MLRWLIGIILGEIICESSNWQHIQRLKITILGANWQLFILSTYFILSTQNIKFHWIVMKIKKFLLPIWWYNRDSFPLRNKYNVVFVLNGLSKQEIPWQCYVLFKSYYYYYYKSNYTSTIERKNIYYSQNVQFFCFFFIFGLSVLL